MILSDLEVYFHLFIRYSHLLLPMGQLGLVGTGGQRWRASLQSTLSGKAQQLLSSDARTKEIRVQHEP